MLPPPPHPQPPEEEVTVTVSGAVWVRAGTLAVPVTDTLYVAAVLPAVTASVAVIGVLELSVMVMGFVNDVHDPKPTDRAELACRVTLPLQPLTLVTVMVEVPQVDAARLRELGLADMLKPATLTSTVNE